ANKLSENDNGRRSEPKPLPRENCSEMDIVIRHPAGGPLQSNGKHRSDENGRRVWWLAGRFRVRWFAFTQTLGCGAKQSNAKQFFDPGKTNGQRGSHRPSFRPGLRYSLRTVPLSADEKKKAGRLRQGLDVSML